MISGVDYSTGRLKAGECTYIRDQQWGARPTRKNEHQILKESWVRGIRDVGETFKENTLGNMMRPCWKDLWLRFDALNSWKQIKRVIWVPYKVTKNRTFPSFLLSKTILFKLSSKLHTREHDSGLPICFIQKFGYETK